MSAETTNRENDIGGPEDTEQEPDWESIALQALSQLFYAYKDDLQYSMGTISTRLEDHSDTDVTAEEIQQFREDFYQLRGSAESPSSRSDRSERVGKGGARGKIDDRARRFLPTVHDGPQTVQAGWRVNEATVRFSAWTGRGQPTPKSGPPKRA